MTADQGLPSSPLKFPTISPRAPLAAVSQRPEKCKSAPAAGMRKDKSVGRHKEVTARRHAVDGLRRRSLSMLVPRSGDELTAAQHSSLVRRGSIPRRRSGDFSLPVRYKYVVIPGNNSRAVLAAFRRRPWWGPARKEEDAAAADVLRSTFQSRRKKIKGGRGESRARSGYSAKSFNLWWEMHGSRPVIEATNLDPNMRQAVNHFEFNATLVSKKGMYKSLRTHCTLRGGPNLAEIVPETFYLAGGALQADLPGSASCDDRAEFLEYCVGMDARSAVSIDSLNAADEAPGSYGSYLTDEETKSTPFSSVTPRRDDPPRTRSTQDIENIFQREDELDLKNAQSRPSGSHVGKLHIGCAEEVGRDGEREDAVALNADTPEVARETAAGARPEECLASNGDTSDGNATCSDRTMMTTGLEARGTTGGTPTWVVKPAANSNCGFGIQVCCDLKGISVQKPTSSQRPRREANLKLLNRRGVDLSTQEVLEVVDNSGNKAGRNGWVVQRYIERPLLVQGRKFDVRMFVLLVADPSTRSWRRRSKSTPPSCTKNHISTADGQFLEEPEGPQTEESPSIERGSARGKQREVGPSPLTAWCHRDAYVRMSSVKYSNDPEKAKDRFVHLTNNAVQRRSPSYGKDEPGNKLTLENLQEWLDNDGSSHKGKAIGWVQQTMRPRMHAMVETSVAAAAAAGINKRGRPHAFELLGYDFMVDDDLRVWLIEVNSNPCLEFVCPLLQDMIMRVVDDALKVAVDPVFRPPEKHRTSKTLVSGGTPGAHTPVGGFSRVYPVVQ